MSFPFFCPLLGAAAEDLAAEDEDVAVVAGRFLAVGALEAGLLPPLNSTCGPDSSKRSSPPSPLFLGMRKLLCFFLGTWATRLLPVATFVGGGDGLLLLPLLLLLRRCRTVDSFSFSSLERFFSRGCFEVPSFFFEVVVVDGLSGESLNLPLYSSRMLGAGGGVADLEEEEDVAAGGGAASLGSDLRWPGLLGGAGEDDFGGTEEELADNHEDLLYLDHLKRFFNSYCCRI